MNLDNSDNDFQQLRRLLTLKRYEVPPPRYFNEFSGRVTARLSEPAREPSTWWQRLGFDFDLKPAFMCGLGVVICGLLSFGIIGAMQISDSQDAPVASRPISDTALPSPIAGILPSTGVEASSVAPWIAQGSGSPFSQFTPRATPVGFTFGAQ